MDLTPLTKHELVLLGQVLNFFAKYGAQQSQGHIFLFVDSVMYISGLPCGSDGKASAYSAGDLGLIPGLGRSSGEGNGNPLQYSCLENPMDGEACWATVHGVTHTKKESDTTE